MKSTEFIKQAVKQAGEKTGQQANTEAASETFEAKSFWTKAAQSVTTTMDKTKGLVEGTAKSRTQ